MNENDLKVAIEKLVAIGEFVGDLKGKLEKELNLLENSIATATTEEAHGAVAIKTTAPAKLAEVNVAEDSDEVVDIDSIIEEYELNSMKIGEIREYLDGYKIEYPDKAKKTELVIILANSIADGTIPQEEDEEGTAPSDDAPVEVTTDDSSTSDGDDFEPSDERLNAEDKVEDNIRNSFPKKLKVSAIKKFLTMYYDGDVDMDLDEFTEDELLDKYVEIQRALVDDDGDVHAIEDPYFRDGVVHCCGKPTVDMEDSENVYCEVCGNEYK